MSLTPNNRNLDTLNDNIRILFLANFMMDAFTEVSKDDGRIMHA